jgi:hypothetical protein
MILGKLKQPLFAKKYECLYAVGPASVQFLVVQSRALRGRLLDMELLSPNDVHVRYLMIHAF